jgi:mono/diheme cytochrome c family protein
MGSNLTTGEWLWGDGSLAAIEATIRKGVDTPKKGSGVMPPLGGVDLNDADVKAVASYVWALGHRPK